MKMDNDDIMWAKLLKEGQPEVQESQWFTKRVLGKLPIKEPAIVTLSWGERVAFLIFCLAVCIVSIGIYFENFNFSVITVRNLITTFWMLTFAAGIVGYALYNVVTCDN